MPVIRPTQTMPIHISVSITRSFRPRGGRSMTSSGGGSRPIASAGAVSVSRLTHRICVASNGTAIASPVSSRPSCLANRTPKNIVSTSPMFDDSRKRRNRRMFSKIPRPSPMAATIVAKLSSARIMSAAPLATSVPVTPIATPMSAAFSAGASLTPSPVIATIRPSCCRASTMRSLCSGATRANTETSATATRSATSSSRSSSAPLNARAPSPMMPRSAAIPLSLMMPRSAAMRDAVKGWSPVIMITRTPARRASAIAVRASSRGGSMIPTMPR